MTNFKVRLENNRLVYEFFVPFQISCDRDIIDLRIAVYDKTFFCDIAFVEKETVRLEDSAVFKLDYSINRNRDTAISYDNTYIGTGREDTDYIGTAYPMEAHIRLTKIKQ